MSVAAAFISHLHAANSYWCRSGCRLDINRGLGQQDSQANASARDLAACSQLSGGPVYVIGTFRLQMRVLFTFTSTRKLSSKLGFNVPT